MDSSSKVLKKGYAAEAALALKAYAVDVLKISKLIAHCDRKNINSEKIMQKIGLQKEEMIGNRQYPDERGIGEEFTYSLVISELPD